MAESTTAHATQDVPVGALRSVSCPRCAGLLGARDGDRVIECASCATPFLTGLEDGFSRRYFPARVQRLEAVGKAARWLWEHPDAPSDIRESAFVEAELLYVPIWEYRAHVVGWEFGHKIRTRSEIVHMGEEDVVVTELVDEPVEEGYLGERRFYQEAADLSILGMGRPRITGREHTLPYLAGELERGAVVLQSERDLGSVRDRARKTFLCPPTGTVGRESRLFLLKESAALIYYPLWSLRYRYRGRLYEMIVDARTGAVHAARAPADNSRRIAWFLASYGVLAVLLAAALSAGSTWQAAAAASPYAVMLVVALAVASFSRFRLVKEVDYHEPFSA